MFNFKNIKKAKLMREAWGANDAKRDENFQISESVKVIKDLMYGPYGKWNLLDLNIPKTHGTDKLPVIVNFHGGGFFYGSKETYKFYAAHLAQKGFAVVNFNYRLSPESKFPNHLKDCNRVLLWINDHANEYNLDTNRIYFAGDSAGGNLVYFYSTILSNPEYAKLYPFEPAPLKPKAVAMNCALYNLMEDPNADILKWYIPNLKKFPEQLDIQKYVTKDFPPSFIMSAANDFLLPQLEPQVEFLKSKNVTCVSKVYGKKEDPNASHVFHINLALPDAVQCNMEEVDFFNSYK